MVRRAGFPFFKTIDDFNFSMQSTVRLVLLGSALAPDFVTDGRCRVFGGKPGRGNTHLAVAIAYRAIQNGFDALFVTAAELIDDLPAAFRTGRLADTLAHYVHPAVLIIDEVGYLTYGTDAANRLFPVVNDRHRKKRTMIFTTNKPLAGGAACCTMRTWLTLSSIGSSSVVGCSRWTGHQCAPGILGLTTPR
jgi:DNA replication protein DnaC